MNTQSQAVNREQQNNRTRITQNKQSHTAHTYSHKNVHIVTHMISTWLVDWIKHTYEWMDG